MIKRGVRIIKMYYASKSDQEVGVGVYPIVVPSVVCDCHIVIQSNCLPSSREIDQEPSANDVIDATSSVPPSSAQVRNGCNGSDD